MALKEKFFAMLQKLSPEELAELRETLLSADKETSPAPKQALAPSAPNAEPDEAPAEEKAADEADVSETTADEETQDETGGDDETDSDDDGEEADETDEADDEADTDDEETEPVGESAQDDPPAFDKSAPAPDEEAETTAEAEPIPETAPEQSEQLTDENGEDLPVDYAQIIDGLNAKILALEAENKALKAKTEGAFGLPSITAGNEPIARSALYDNDASALHFRKIK